MKSQLLKNQNVFLCYNPVDFRKNINGLAGIVQGSFGQDPFNGELFVFINKSKNAVKVLQWDTDGFVLYHKRRERGKFFWPSLKDEESTIEISSNDLERLLAGLIMEKFIPRKNYTIM